MNFEASQKDMRLSYVNGSSGVFISSLLWLSAGLLAYYVSTQVSLLVFFFGGMLIHPLGILLSKLFKRTGQHQKNNPLAKLALESTVLLFIGLFIA